MEVFFDEFKVSHTKSPVIQTEDYYAFGLAISDKSYQKAGSRNNPYQYNGKEKQDELDLGWLDYGARMYLPEIGRWGVVDPLADSMRRYSPYVMSYNNPIRFLDPDGLSAQDVTIVGAAKEDAFDQLQSSVEGELTLSMDKNGNVTYCKNNGDAQLSKNAQQLAAAIDDKSVIVRVDAEKSNFDSNGRLIIGGAFEGNDCTIANQRVNPEITNNIDAAAGAKSGSTMLHEVTEAYIGAKISQKEGKPADVGSLNNTTYLKAHLLATPQPGDAGSKYPLSRYDYDSGGVLLSPVLDQNGKPTVNPKTACAEFRVGRQNSVILKIGN